MTIAVITHTFTGVGVSPSLVTPGAGALNVTIGNTAGGFTGTVRLRRSFDSGATWHVVSTPDGMLERVHIAPISYWQYEQEEGVMYQLECTVFTSGPIPVRLSR